MKIVKQYTIEDIETQIENGVATLVRRASFDQGDESEIETKFYRLWGMVIRFVLNRSNRVRRYYFVKGEDLELFNAHYS